MDQERTTVWILGDQLSPRISSLSGCDPASTVVLLVESRRRAGQLPYHQQKLVLLWSAMRHFAQELRMAGWTVDYRLTDGDFSDALLAHLAVWDSGRLRLAATAEHGVDERLAVVARELGLTVEVTANNLFIVSREAFTAWAAGRRRVVMEDFYRWQRRRTGLLMTSDCEPEGGAWNFDRQNRQRPPAGTVFPAVPSYPPDPIVSEVMALVAARYSDHFGQLAGFAWPVTRTAAEDFATDFLDQRLDGFGPYQDALVAGEPVLCHSLLSPLLNLGLLDPLWLCQQAEQRYQDGSARLNSVEGFIRQVLGWREFVHQIYHQRMPDYLTVNELEADLPLPAFYWTGETAMACVAEAVAMLRERGINHHIQRLMVTGNFALLAGCRPQEVNDWYLLAYVDAYEWVVTPNVLGMALFADGGLVATKPYAASANYLDKMSDHCQSCRYRPDERLGDDACPFNSLYWDFLARHRERFAGNRRMALMISLLDRRDPDELAAMRMRARWLRERIRAGEPI